MTTTWIASAWTVVIVTVLVAPVLRKRRTWLRLLICLVSLAFLTAAMEPLVGSPFQPRFAPDLQPLAAFSEKVFVAGWWFLMARLVIYAGHIAFGINHQRHAARLLADLAGGAIYLGTLLAIIDLVFGIPVAGLVATSGVIAIVLGLALQSTLNDLFSGLAIGIDRTFGVGDLVVIEGAAEGRVIETNWRSTRIQTDANDIAAVPNSVVAKARITNRSAPSEVHTATIKVTLDPRVRPKDAITMLRASALNTASLSSSGSLSVACVDLLGEGSVYEVQFSTPLRTLREVRSDLLIQIARHARYHGIGLAPANGRSPDPAPDRSTLLAEIPIMAALEKSERDALAGQLVRHEGEAGHRLVIQGGGSASLFVIARGAFAVTRDIGAASTHLGTIGPGDYLGELALLTGTPNAATVVALTPFLAFEVTKALMSPLLKDNPDLLHAFERAASEAQALLDRKAAAQVSAAIPSDMRLIDRIRAFFDPMTSSPV